MTRMQVGEATLEPATLLQSWCLESRSVGEGSSAHCSPYCVGWQVVRSHQQRRRWAMIYLLLHECHGVVARRCGASLDTIESGAGLRDSVDAIVVCHVSEITSK